MSSLSKEGFDPWLCQVPSGDDSKSLKEASRLYSDMLHNGMDRKSALVALGGGMIGDLTGFVAATYMRGIPFVQAPTTLLAQVDASVGGKTAVNHPESKNLVGAFHQPKLVVIDTGTLETLSDRDFSSGMAEVIKHGLILDPEFWSFIEDNVTKIMAREISALDEMIAWSCRIKARIVERDEKESGLRAVLNYGHTVAHAMESATGYDRFRHGEAVSIGMVCAGIISRARSMIDDVTMERLVSLLSSMGLPTSVPSDLDPLEIVRLIKHDKKVQAGKLNFILLEGIGEVRIYRDVTQEEILLALAEAKR
jgi:3-dehydroquinate synthase